MNNMTEKPWLQHYPKGVPANIDADSVPRLIDMVDECLKRYRDLPAFISMGKTITFGELDQLSTQFGAYLHSRGLEPGDRIALMMPEKYHGFYANHPRLKELQAAQSAKKSK